MNKNVNGGKSEIVAADILKSEHPLNTVFARWLAKKGSIEPSKRQARKFLGEFPQFRQLPKAA